MMPRKKKKMTAAVGQPIFKTKCSRCSFVGEGRTDNEAYFNLHQHFGGAHYQEFLKIVRGLKEMDLEIAQCVQVIKT